MKRVFRTRKAKIIGMIVAIPVLAVFGIGIWLASIAGELPWQTDPTRISEGGSFTAFEGLAVGTPRTTRAATPQAGSASPVASPDATSGTPTASPAATVVTGSPVVSPAGVTPTSTAAP